MRLPGKIEEMLVACRAYELEVDESLRRIRMTEEERALVEAALRFDVFQRDYMSKTAYIGPAPELTDLLVACAAYRKTLEPPNKRWSVVKWADSGGTVYCIHDTQGRSLPNNFEPQCRDLAQAERICRLLNQDSHAS